MSAATAGASRSEVLRASWRKKRKKLPINLKMPRNKWKPKEKPTKWKSQFWAKLFRDQKREEKFSTRSELSVINFEDSKLPRWGSDLQLRETVRTARESICCRWDINAIAFQMHHSLIRINYYGKNNFSMLKLRRREHDRGWVGRGKFFPFCAKQFVYISVDFTLCTIGIKEKWNCTNANREM